MTVVAAGESISFILVTLTDGEMIHQKNKNIIGIRVYNIKFEKIYIYI